MGKINNPKLECVQRKKKQEEVGSGNHFIEGVLDENKEVEFRAMKKGKNPHYSRKCFNYPIVQQRKRLFC